MNKLTGCPQNVEDILRNKNILQNNANLIITGSFAVRCIASQYSVQDFSNYNNGISDIDLIIMVDDERGLPKLIGGLEKEMFAQKRIQVINYSYKYGSHRNAFNIKFLSQVGFNSFSSFERILYKSWRKVPLTTFKKKELFFCSDGETYVMNYQEDCYKSGYILSLDFFPFRDNVYRFSNIHSMLFNSVIVSNDGIMYEKIYRFKNEMHKIFSNLDHRTKKLMFSSYIKKGIIKECDVERYINSAVCDFNFSNN